MNLNNLKLMLGITDTAKDGLLTLILGQCAEDYLGLTHQDSTDGAEMLILRMAVVRYNLIGCEGLGSQNYNGLSESYEGYGNDILAAIKTHRKARVI